MVARMVRSFVLVMLVLAMAGCATPTPTTTITTPSPVSLAPTELPENVLLICVPEEDYAPLTYQDSSGQWTGLDVELTRALLNEAGFTPDFVRLPWSRALEYMKTGEIQLMMNVSKTDERSEFMYWIGPERVSRMVLAVKAGNEGLPITTLDDFPLVAAQQNTRFGIQQDVFYSPEFNDRLNAPDFAAGFELVPQHSLNPNKVLTGHILGFFEEETFLKYMIQQSPEYAGLALHPFVLTQEEVYFGISKKGVSEEARERLQAAYTRLEQNGTFEEIRTRNWSK